VAISKEAKVGLLALIAGVVLYLGFNFLKGYELFSNTNRFFIIYKKIDGLTASNPVVLNGLNVGRVQKIELLPERNNQILVTIDVDEAVQVGDSTLAQLSNTDLLGGKSIELILGKNSVVYDGDDTLKGYKKQDFTEELTAKALPILSNLDSTVVKLNQIFGDELGNSIKITLHNLELTSHDLKLMMAGNRSNISAITGNLASLTASLNETEKQLKPVIAKLDHLADSLNNMELKQTIRNANAALKNVESITSKIDENKGSLGLLVNDKQLYDNLNKTAAQLNKIADDISKNPKRYLKISVF
jgi:phospholipid/cholesterol/gamma-HCH transport system substrate-binding protein